MQTKPESLESHTTNVSSLHVSGLIQRYKNKLVLDSIEFQAFPGEVLAIIGPNGAGKSTLLHSIAGITPVRSGTVTYDAKQLLELSNSERAKLISLMPQLESKDISLSVQQVVSLGRAPASGWSKALSQHDRDVVEDAIKSVGLTSQMHQPVRTLSGGEWRRMMLARSLAQQSKIMLLDEPTEGLDLRFQQECLATLRTVVKTRNLVAIVTLHDLNQASVYADKIAILHQGRLICIGPPAEVLTQQSIFETYGLHVEIVNSSLAGTPVIVPLPPKRND